MVSKRVFFPFLWHCFWGVWRVGGRGKSRLQQSNHQEAIRYSKSATFSFFGFLSFSLWGSDCCSFLWGIPHLGLLGGVALSAFSKTLAILLGMLVLGVQVRTYNPPSQFPFPLGP